jgi:hypothetical protein
MGLPPSRDRDHSGFLRQSELARFCDIITSPASELEYLLLLVSDLKRIQPDDYEQLVQQTAAIKQLLTVFIRKLRTESAQPFHQLSKTLVAASGRARSNKSFF